MPIAILPLLNVSSQTLDDLREEIGNAFLSSVTILPAIRSLPDSAYNKKREQYDADKLVSHLRQQTKGANADKVVAVGSIDLFVTDLNFIFGAAEKGGKLAVISLYRLDQRFYGKQSSYDSFKERAAKEAIHELGHCYGLDHCKRGKCVMVYSNDVVSVDRKAKFFCEECREKLRKALL